MDTIQNRTISSSVPLVFLLDLDQTIQGDVSPQLAEYKLIDHLNANFNIKKYSRRMKLPQNRRYIIQDMHKGLLRPHFKRFIVKMRRRYSNCEFFIYTASETEWAKYVVKIIEEAINVKFNARIFTRSDCIYDDDKHKYMKSIKHVSPDIFKALKRKYKLKGDRKTYIFEHIHMVDNNKILYKSERENLIQCEEYNKRVVIDVLRSLPRELLETNFKAICRILYDKKCDSLVEFYKMHYTNLFDNQEVVERINNVHYHKDRFWITLLKRLKKSYKIQV
jgi:hypothetical protein